MVFSLQILEVDELFEMVHVNYLGKTGQRGQRKYKWPCSRHLDHCIMACKRCDHEWIASNKVMKKLHPPVIGADNKMFFQEL